LFYYQSNGRLARFGGETMIESNGALATYWPDVGILCIWLPQLPLRVEVLRHPAWDGRPLVIGGEAAERNAVRLCSPEAERAGIRPGLPLREVLALCSDAIVLPHDPVRAATVLEEILPRLQEVGPTVELGKDRAYLSLHGLRRLYHDDFAELERAIRAAVPALLGPRIGVGRDKFTAWVAACEAPPHGRRVVPDAATTSFLAPLPVRYLPFPPKISWQLHLLRLRTIADLAALSFSAVQAQFGSMGARAWRLATGRDDEPLVPHRFNPTIRVALGFDAPLASVDAIMAALGHLVVRAFNDLTLQGRAIRKVRLRALLSDGASWEWLNTFKDPFADREAAYRALKSRLEIRGNLPTSPIEDLSLELMGLTSETGKQPSLFAAHARQLSQVVEVVRQLSTRYGYVPLYRAVEVEPWSRLPERRWALVPCDL
jgi:DNA polymerase-4/protein ImuB